MLNIRLPASTDAAENRLGIAFMCLASACFITNDALTKLVSDDLPLGQIMFIRGAIASPLILGLAVWRGGFRSREILVTRPLWLRTFSDIMATLLYLSALFRMPIANATALLQTTPLVTTAVAALLLGERVGVRRWAAVFVGFLGMLAIVRPGFSGFSVWSLVALLAVVFIVLRDLSTRFLPPQTSTFEVAAIASIAVTTVGGIIGLGEAWQPVQPVQFLFLTGSGITILGAYVSITLAMRHGELSVVAPFRYSIMIWAILFQIVLFSTLPDLWALVGTAILIATGIYTFYREQSLAVRRQTLDLDAK